MPVKVICAKRSGKLLFTARFYRIRDRLFEIFGVEFSGLEIEDHGKAVCSPIRVVQQRRKIPGVKDRVRFVDNRIPVPLLPYDNGRFVMIHFPLYAHFRQDHTLDRTVFCFLPDDEIGIITRLKIFDIQVGGPDMYRITFLRPDSERDEQKDQPTQDIFHDYRSLVAHKYDSYFRLPAKEFNRPPILLNR